MTDTTLHLWQCGRCGQSQSMWHKRYCTRCRGTDLIRVAASGQARLLSWATYHQDYRLPGFEPPYSVGLIRLVEGPGLTCLLAGDLSTAEYDQLVSVLATPSPMESVHQVDSTHALIALVPSDITTSSHPER